MGKGRKILFKGETITIVLHKFPEHLEMIFYGYTQRDEFIKAWNALLSLKEGKEFKGRWLLDQYYMHVQPDELKWCMSDWFPKMVKQCTPKASVAIVPAVNFVGNFQVKEDAKKIQSDFPSIKIEFFDSFDAALGWLEKR